MITGYKTKALGLEIRRENDKFILVVSRSANGKFQKVAEFVNLNSAVLFITALEGIALKSMLGSIEAIRGDLDLPIDPNEKD